MAPEIMNRIKYDSKVDMWSLGTVMYNMLVGFAPFSGFNEMDLIDNVNIGLYGIPKDVTMSLKCLDLLNKLLRFDPEKRISHEDLLDHPFLNESTHEEGTINLVANKGFDQTSFFEPPKHCLEINNKNAFIFDSKDSCLFNDLYQDTLNKFKKKISEEVRISPKTDESKDNSDFSSCKSESSDQEKDEDNFTSFTVITRTNSKNTKEVSKNAKNSLEKPISSKNTDKTDSLRLASCSALSNKKLSEVSSLPSNAFKSQTKWSERDPLNDSFEIQHYHDIQILSWKDL
jgi:serine/threonine protein kinase